MRLPNGDRADIPERKLTDFLLNENHPEQPGHAVLFRQLLGVGLHNSDVLRDALARAAAENEATLDRHTPFGDKYLVRFPMRGQRGMYTVLSVWIIETGVNTPRLVTAYIE